MQDSKKYKDTEMPAPLSAFELIPLPFIQETYRKISPHLVRTPVIESEHFNHIISKQVGHDVKLYFKAEPLQKTGSFKARGALASVLAVAEQNNLKGNSGNPPYRGVVTHSSGNLGAATAWAAQQVGLEAAIVCLKVASPAKLANIASYGADIVKTEFSPQAVSEACQNIIANRGYRFLSPYDEQEEVAGQATVGLEFLEDVPQLDALIAPTSGGGLIAGLCVGAKQIKPNIKIYAAAPKHKSLGEAIRNGERPSHWTPANFVKTNCDALRAHPGVLTFPIICELAEREVFEVMDHQAAAAMEEAWRNLHVTLEISSSLAVAAIFSKQFIDTVAENSLRHIGIVLTGGNVDVDAPLPWTVIENYAR